jgi:hypothetical protein
VQLDEALHCKLEGHGFNSQYVSGNFHQHNTSGCNLVLRSTQPLTEMSNMNTSWGVKAGRA